MTTLINWRSIEHGKGLKMDPNKVELRMRELMQPVDQQIMMCDNTEDLLMMACAMLQRSKNIFDDVLGEEGRRKMFKDIQ